MLLPGRAVADEIKPLPPDGILYGQRLADWAVAYNQWAFSLPQDVSTFAEVDTTGKRAGFGQRGPVWFVPRFGLGSNGSRTFAVPEGQAVLVSLAQNSARRQPGEVSDDELMWLLDEELAWGIQLITRLEVSMDGTPVPNLEAYRVRTPVFSIPVPPGYDTWLTVPVGADARVATAVEGYFVMFPPLPVGKHVLTLRREGGNAGDSHWTFNLVVQRPNERPQ
jgi:hypothetical protein